MGCIKCSHCNKDIVDKHIIILADGLDNGEVIVSYFDSFLCLKKWLSEHR